MSCPQCATRWSTEQTLAVHLMDAHGMDASPAVARAMQVAHECGKQKTGLKPKKAIHESPEVVVESKKRPMNPGDNYTCSKCGVKGHHVSVAGPLATLRAYRDGLDSAIAALERLEARGR